jgi:hypothetical protein
VTDNDHTDHEQLTRRLHEQAQAQAPAGRYAAVSHQLRAWAAAKPAGAPGYDVQIRRAAASARLALTCP